VYGTTGPPAAVAAASAARSASSEAALALDGRLSPSVDDSVTIAAEVAASSVSEIGTEDRSGSDVSSEVDGTGTGMLAPKGV